MSWCTRQLSLPKPPESCETARQAIGKQWNAFALVVYSYGWSRVQGLRNLSIYVCFDMGHNERTLFCLLYRPRIEQVRFSNSGQGWHTLVTRSTSNKTGAVAAKAWDVWKGFVRFAGCLEKRGIFFKSRQMQSVGRRDQASEPLLVPCARAQSSCALQRSQRVCSWHRGSVWRFLHNLKQ